jgi:hypothetical protein
LRLIAMTLFSWQLAAVVHGISEFSPSAEPCFRSWNSGTSLWATLVENVPREGLLFSLLEPVITVPKACRQGVVLDAFCKARLAKDVNKGSFVSDASESA